MKTASVTEAKNNLSRLIDGLKGGPVLILHRGRPVARLEPAAAAGAKLDPRLAELVRRGLATPPRESLTKAFLEDLLPPLPPGLSLVDALLAERDENL